MVSLAQFVEAYLTVGLGERNKRQRFDREEEVGPTLRSMKSKHCPHGLTCLHIYASQHIHGSYGPPMCPLFRSYCPNNNHVKFIILIFCSLIMTDVKKISQIPFHHISFPCALHASTCVLLRSFSVHHFPFFFFCKTIFMLTINFPSIHSHPITLLDKVSSLV